MSPSPHAGRHLPRVTIAIPLLNEAERLPALLEAILAQHYPVERLEVLLVDGGSSDSTRDLAAGAAERHPHMQVLDNPLRLAAVGLNLALARANGDVFLRLDARTRPAQDYIDACVQRLQDGDWVGVAGPQIAVGETPAGRVYALVLNHPLGTGGPRYRRAEQPQESETLYLGAYHTARLRQIGGWDERFAANEDYELNTRLRAAGGRLLVDPGIRCAYLVRDDLRALARQYGHYGAWRTVTWRRHRNALRPRHLAPALLAATLALAVLLLPWTYWALLAWAIPYVGAVVVVSFVLTRQIGWRAFPRLCVTFLTLHLAWGTGFWLAWLRSPRISLPAPGSV